MKIFFGLMLFFFLAAANVIAREVKKEAPADYEVPVPDALKNSSHFKLKDCTLATVEGRQQFSYTMPSELVGKPGQKVIFNVIKNTRSPSVISLNGAQGKGNCRVVKGANLVCKIKYENLAIDKAGIKTILDSEKLAPAKQQALYAVAQIFTSDPIGIIIYDLEPGEL